MVLSWQIYRLSLKDTFTISYGSYNHRDALIVSLSQSGNTGYGECTEIDYYQVSLEKFTQQLQQIQGVIENQTIQHPIQFYAFLESLQLHSFLRSALDCAYWDLYGKLEDKSFLSLNAISYKILHESSITVSVGSITEQLHKINTLDWDRIKVKCNRENVKEVHQLLASDKIISLDANGSFLPEDCFWLQEQSFTQHFAYIEQPMAIGVENFSQLTTHKYPNWMADEDCKTAADLQLLQPHYHTINIKLVKCGGLTPALDLIHQAREKGFKIMMGCMTESTIGISAGAVLTPLVDYIDLDGANLILNDIAQGSFVEKGKIYLSEKAGLGIELVRL